MNKIRRAALVEIALKLEDIYNVLVDLAEEEEQYRDNMPENLKQSARYEKSENASSYIGDALESIESAIADLGEAYEC